MKELNKRNTETVEQALKDMYLKIEEQEKRISGLNSTMSVFYDRISYLENMINLQKMKLTGVGSSVKE